MMKDNASAESGGFVLSEDEKRQLMDAIDEVEKDLPKDGDDE
jgi:hypothetical protein